MIRYLYKQPKILFVGINPHLGSFDRGVPFSNNKSFWYLLSDAGIIHEKRDELRDDESLRRMYTKKFNAVYRLGFVNLIDRPTRDVSELRKGEELPGRKKISRIIRTEMPKVVCFIGKITYEKYTSYVIFPIKQTTFGISVLIMREIFLRPGNSSPFLSSETSRVGRSIRFTKPNRYTALNFFVYIRFNDLSSRSSSLFSLIIPASERRYQNDLLLENGTPRSNDPK